jgi:hypothetical protein
MTNSDLKSSHFSDENGYIICTIWKSRIEDMNYAIILILSSDFNYVQNLFIQKPNQRSYMDRSWRADQNGHMVCPKRICKSAVLNTLKSIQISKFSETNKKKQEGGFGFNAPKGNRTRADSVWDGEQCHCAAASFLNNYRMQRRYRVLRGITEIPTVGTEEVSAAVLQMCFLHDY